MVGRIRVVIAYVVGLMTVGVAVSRGELPGFSLSGALYTVDGGLSQTPRSTYGPTEFSSDLENGTQSASLWEAAAFRWNVTWDGGADSLVTYTYTFDINALGTLQEGGGTQWRELSHFSIEVSEGLTLGPDLQNVRYNDGRTPYNDGTRAYITDSVHGDYGSDWALYPSESANGDPRLEVSSDPNGSWLKFDEITELNADAGVWEVQFESSRLPMWGELDLVDGVSAGTRVTASTQNTGGYELMNLNGEVDWLEFVEFYQGDPSFWDDNYGVLGVSTVSYEEDGSPVYGILVPDTATITDTDFTYVPEPGSALLGLLLMMVGFTFRRRRRGS